MNDWRIFRYRPRTAHLWEVTANGYCRSKCGRLVLRDWIATSPLINGESIPKCRLCLSHEIRRAQTANHSGEHHAALSATPH